MAKNRMNPATLENVRLIFRNFSGKESQFNRAGDMNFGVILDHDVAEQMAADGWNVKYLRPREEEDEPQPWIQVAVSYKGKPPRIVMISSKGRNQLGPDDVNVLDWVEIENVDLIINPYQWEVNGKTGVKAYAQTVFVTIREDELELKYSQNEDEG